MTLGAKVTGGNRALNIPLRWQGPKDHYMLNVGVAGHRRWSLEKMSRDRQSFPLQGDKKRPGVEVDKWYKVRIRAQGAHIQGWLDGEQIVDFVDKDKPLLHGKVGVSTKCGIFMNPFSALISLRIIVDSSLPITAVGTIG